MNKKYTDPNSPSYDPYFSFRYEIDYENKRIRKKETSEVLKEIRNYEINNQQQKNIDDIIIKQYFGNFDGVHIAVILGDVISRQIQPIYDFDLPFH